MAQAIKRVGLEPYAVNASDHYHRKATLYAYLRAKIPMMFGFGLYDTSYPQARFFGKHAVAITGYSLGHEQADPLERTTFLLTATRIDKIYVHDDQVGPFSRMVFDNQMLEYPDRDGIKVEPSILTSWLGANGAIGGKRAISEILLIPVYHKIRIPFGVIHDLVLEFDFFLKQVIAAIVPSLSWESKKLEWDIFLSSVNDLKTELINSDRLDEGGRRDVLLQSLPVFFGGQSYCWTLR